MVASDIEGNTHCSRRSCLFVRQEAPPAEALTLRAKFPLNDYGPGRVLQ